MTIVPMGEKFTIVVDILGCRNLLDRVGYVTVFVFGRARFLIERWRNCLCEPGALNFIDYISSRKGWKHAAGSLVCAVQKNIRRHNKRTLSHLGVPDCSSDRVTQWMMRRDGLVEES